MTDAPHDTDAEARLSRALGAQYQVRTLIGRGGFAEVYEVWDRELERRLAVKVLRPDVAWTSGMLQRFKHETRAIARLQHPNILPIHFVGEGEGLVYYAMPFVEGESLGDVLRRGALAPERALAIAAPILEALQHAHERGLVHRDIKPDNIMLDVASGRPTLVDFGIAKQLDGDGGLTQTGFVVGTPHYMSPEQALGQGKLDARSDLYSFGAVLYQMVTGSPPFDGESSQEIVGKHITEPPPLASTVNAATPQWLSAVIARCLAKKPGERYPSASAVLGALGAGPRAPAPPAVERAGGRGAAVDANAETELVASGEQAEATRPIRRTRRWRGVSTAVILVAVTLAAIWFLRPRLVFSNPLVAPVRLIVGARDFTVGPSGRVVVRLPVGRPASILWTLIPPSDAGGAAWGAEMSGAFTVQRPRGRIRRSATPRSGDQIYFAPLVTNGTAGPITVVVNAETGAAMACDCWVPPGAVRMPIGYYPLYRDSRVQVRDREGRTATFENVAAEVNRATGAVGVPVDESVLR